MTSSTELVMPILFGSALGVILSACTPEAPAFDNDDFEPAEMGALPIAETAQAPGIHEQLLPPDGLRYTIAIPEEYSHEQAVPLILALHYGGQVTPFYGKGFLVGLVEPALRDLGAIIVAPDSATGDWANPQAEANILTLLDAILVTYRIDRRKILLTGYSMGGMGTWYLAGRNQERFTAALPIAARPQPDSTELDWRIPLYVLHSRRDELIALSPTETAVEELQKRGADVTLVVVDGITHYDVGRFTSHLQDAIPWIQESWRSDD